MTRLKYRILILITCLPSLLSAQSTWVAGKIVTLSKDTIAGEILFRDWVTSPSQINFKTTESTADQIINAPDVLGFIIDSGNIAYVSTRAVITYYSQSGAAPNRQPIVDVDSTISFHERILKSDSISLSRFIDKREVPRYFISKGRVAVELQNIRYKVTLNDHVIERHYPFYKQQLKSLFDDCRAFQVDGIAYNITSLERVCRRYLECKGMEPLRRSSNFSRPFVTFGPTIGGLKYFSGFTEMYMGLSTQYRLPKRFLNRFVMATVKVAIARHGEKEIDIANVDLGLYGGSYFGVKNRIQPFVFGGLSFSSGPLDVGIGLAANKRFQIAVHSGLLFDIGGGPNASLDATFFFR
jgi:hypothetical protein